MKQGLVQVVNETQSQPYSICGFWSFPSLPEHQREKYLGGITRFMAQRLAEHLAPVKGINLTAYFSNNFTGGDSFWGRDISTDGSQAIAILGEVTTRDSRNCPEYIKPPIQWNAPGLLLINSSFETNLLKGDSSKLENTLLHFLYLNYPKSGEKVELVFDRSFEECTKELSQRDFVNYLQTYRTDNRLIAAVSTSEVTPQYFLGYWQSLEEHIGFEAKHDAEGIAMGYGDKTYYCMGPLNRISFAHPLSETMKRTIEKSQTRLLKGSVTE